MTLLTNTDNDNDSLLTLTMTMTLFDNPVNDYETFY